DTMQKLMPKRVEKTFQGFNVMAKSTLKKSLGKKLILTDGAMGSLLVDKGYTRHADMYLLNVERPRMIRAIHSRYIKAGSGIIHTHTFAANYYQLKCSGIESKFSVINRHAVSNARMAAGGSALVAGNVGPSGLPAKKGGLLTEIGSGRHTTHYLRQIQILVSEGVDLIAIETMTNLAEIESVLEALDKSDVSGCPVVFSVSPLSDGRLADGTCLTEWADLLGKSGIAVVGLNCMEGPASMAGLISGLIAGTGLPLSIKPNAGIPLKKGKKWIYSVDSSAFCRQIAGFVKTPVVLVGGCCGTTPAYIGRMKRFF
ncbi:MAG: homocysteine S-methyltransferase family protein, partial [Deltaproteobacteria bacterium]|nr:homocysteine S-methyltransferase family protein [Deltaproteobacteria bacterium]